MMLNFKKAMVYAAIFALVFSLVLAIPTADQTAYEDEGETLFGEYENDLEQTLLADVSPDGSGSGSCPPDDDTSGGSD